MKSIKGTRTEQNLLKAFAGESQARNRYDYFAKVAEKEGYKQISDIFLKTAENERSHAKQFFNFFEDNEVEITVSYPTLKSKSTLENLKNAALGENEEHSKLYPEFANIAKEEGFNEIAIFFKLIGKIEERHERRFLKLAKNIEEGKVFKREETTKWECIKCGHIHEGKGAPENCPACNHPKAWFEIQTENY